MSENKQNWQIFNLSYGKIIPIHDGNKYVEKDISIDVLLHLLQNEWKNSRIAMISDADNSDKSEQFSNDFLAIYGLEYNNVRSKFDIRNNLYELESEFILPKRAYISSFASTYLNIELMAKIDFYLTTKGINVDMFKNIYFIPNVYENISDNNLILWKCVKSDDTYVFIDHSKKEYVKFENSFFKGFYDTITKKELTMTVIEYNPVVKNIIRGLITNNSEYKCEWHGRYVGDILSFEKYNNICDKIKDYTNITNIFTNKSELYDQELDKVIYTLNPEEDLKNL